jgi:uncharacterized iron-regulated membrane protein
MTVSVLDYTTTIDDIVEKVKASYPDHFIIDCICYKDNKSAIKFLIGKEEEGLTHVFVNPYNGNITGESKLISLISFVAHFHKELLLGEFGAWIVRIATMIFLIELISGIILIIPKNRSKLSNVLKVKRGTSFLRKMFDWHRVSGIYPIAILVIMAVTGVIITFSPKYGIEAEHHHHHGEYGEHEQHAHHVHHIPKEQYGNTAKLAALVPVYMNQKNTNAIKIELWNRQVSPTYQFTTGEEVGILTYSGNVHIIDKSTGIKKKNEIRVNHMHINNIMRKLHVGDYWGAFGKAVTFLSGLAGAFLALTGCIIWWKKRFKAIH